MIDLNALRRIHVVDGMAYASRKLGHNLKRLVSIKDRYDPDNRLRFPQGIRPRS